MISIRMGCLSSKSTIQAIEPFESSDELSESVEPFESFDELSESFGDSDDSIEPNSVYETIEQIDHLMRNSIIATDTSTRPNAQLDTIDLDNNWEWATQDTHGGSQSNESYSDYSGDESD